VCIKFFLLIDLYSYNDFLINRSINNFPKYDIRTID